MWPIGHPLYMSMVVGEKQCFHIPELEHHTCNKVTANAGDEAFFQQSGEELLIGMWLVSVGNDTKKLTQAGVGIQFDPLLQTNQQMLSG